MKLVIVSQMQIIPVLIIMCTLHSASVAKPIQATQGYQLVVVRGGSTESVTLTCRDATSADDKDVNSVKYFVNSSECDTDLRERNDFDNIETVGCCSIKFNLLRNREGHYTCGEKINGTLQESLPTTLLSLQTVVTLPDEVETTFTATVDGTAVLNCPIQPGALLQYYSVRWTKSNVGIAEFSTSNGFRSTDSRYSIDRASFSLTINHVNVNDSATSYKCEVYVSHPTGNDNVQLMPSRQISLTLDVIEPIVRNIYSTVKVTIDNMCKCYWNGGKEVEKSSDSDQ